MRHETQTSDIQNFMRELGLALREEGRPYFTGGVSAVLHGGQEMTVDIALRPRLLRYPAIDPATFASKVAAFTES